jgi:hypothetical protein
MAVSGVRRVKIRCPESGEAVPVGMHVSAEAFANLTGQQTFKCPHCFQEHTWSVKDAWTETIWVAARAPAQVRPGTAAEQRL